LANAEFLIDSSSAIDYKKLINYYKTAMQDMKGRSPGQTTMNAVSKLNQFKDDGYKLDFNERYSKNN
jgi:hypothetical protein